MAAVKAEDGDIVAAVEETLEQARQAAAEAVDRAEALAELRGLLFDFCARRRAPQLSVDEMWTTPDDEEERARLQALVDRSLTPQED